jgi:hypothetical protein
MFGVFDREAIPHLAVNHFGEAIEHAKRPVLLPEELGEIGLAEPAGDAVADLDAHLRGDPEVWSWRSEVDLSESAFANEAIEAISAA